MLEHAVCDCEQRSKQLLADALAAQQHEREARQVLAAAREAQGAAERALQQQTQRLLAAERMRLSDLKVRATEAANHMHANTYRHSHSCSAHTMHAHCLLLCDSHPHS